MNRFAVNPDGRTPYQTLHGRRSPDRMLAIGETVYYYIPNRVRHKMDLRWGIGVDLGMANCSNEHYAACGNGTVVKTRSVLSVAAAHRWNADRINKIEGIPGAMNASGKDDDQVLIEERQDPHVNLSDAVEQSDVPLTDERRFGW